MAENRGKKFEEIIKSSFMRVPDTNVIRLPDPVQGYLGYRNPCDFIVYHYPYQYYIECKSVHGNRLPFSNITDNQWLGMLDAVKCKGVIAGVICWWADKEVTRFLPIQTLKYLKDSGDKSISYKSLMSFGEDYQYGIFNILGQKKRIFFDYDMEQFFQEIKGSCNE